ncbi:TetR/AcrR family transcriptional regulator [Rhodococcus rhodochrous]|uniref:TetR/AcrR family transcriptional regulator n=1 Tax=Rhodococcus rhodochrous TaxID=1829 RepID=A0AAW4XLP7_RHORH|nr:MULTISPECIES: TetR/AcrR family transcriptional regulator [Rhodococcus]MCD2113724.1 TetR/AcrR family transcriptional regulator [Rhodococcus rhodochrous]WAL47496.1 TetR/AcrR family transcriptional regulator [Rhodococcus pyridinivorans]
MAYRRTPAVQERLDAQREAIAAAAVALLSERGYSGLSVSAVAERAGVATGSVYRHYVDKSDLMVRIFRELCGREVEAVTSAAATGSGADRVTAVVDTFSRRALRNPTLAYALLAEPVDAAVDVERLVLRRAFAAAFANAVRHGIATGEFPEQDVELTAAALVGAVGEVLTGRLPGAADGRHCAAAGSTVPDLVALALRAAGYLSSGTTQE